MLPIFCQDKSGIKKEMNIYLSSTDKKISIEQGIQSFSFTLKNDSLNELYVNLGQESQNVKLYFMDLKKLNIIVCKTATLLNVDDKKRIVIKPKSKYILQEDFVIDAPPGLYYCFASLMDNNSILSGIFLIEVKKGSIDKLQLRK
jgi:hypothetical protein